MNPLSYSNQSAQPQQAGSPAALTSAQLSQAVSSAAAISQLVCSGAAFLHIGRSVLAELQSVICICSQLACWQKKCLHWLSLSACF